MSRIIVAWLLLASCIGLVPRSVHGDSKPPRPLATEFETLIGRIRAAEATKAWQQPDWKDEPIEAAFDKAAGSR
jgi:hypothetical protein